MGKVVTINDEFRDELICKNYDKEFYEYLDRADSCTFELFLNSKGFDTYEQYQLFTEKYPNLSFEDSEFTQFVNEFIENRDYSEGYVY